MTRHKHTHTGLVIPSPLDRWIDATLRVLAMLVLNVVSTFQMRLRRPAVNATRQMPQPLPGMKIDTFKETQAVQQDSRQALMLSSTRSVRPSKHEGALTDMSHTSPPPSVSLTTSAIHLPLLRRWRQTRLRGIASTAFGGGGGSPRLRGETEGALRPTPNKNAAA